MTESSEPVAWCLGSTSGRKRLRCVAGEPRQSLRHAVFLKYDEPDAPVGNVEVSEICLALDKLHALCAELTNWLALPLAQLGQHPFTFGTDLSDEHGASLKLDFGLRDDLVIGAGQTGCLVEVRTGLLSARMAFVVDATVLGSFADGLDRLFLIAPSPTPDA